MKNTITIVILILFLNVSVSAKEPVKLNNPDFTKSGVVYGGLLLGDGIEGLTAGFGYFQEYYKNIHIGGTIAYTLGEYVVFGGSDVEYYEYTLSARAYQVIPSFRNNHFFFQAGISYNDLEHNNGDTEDQPGAKFGFGGFSGNREYLLMYNYIRMDGEDRKYITLTLAYFFY
ncbi:MAG: hypothetical protein GY714_00420 [Desulfobacterales bacterium]|nr:hypothetical protein [Desulfobacterales bacterium]MCP4159604.1 hypothetical protein [Deltaproteobacteria bacterium]